MENYKLKIALFNLLYDKSQGESFDFRGVSCKAIITDHYWWVSAEYGLKNMLGETPKVYCPDTWLDPIRPEKQIQKEKEKIDIFA